jgi:tetratricopeptide (TPR) repeat protein
LEALPDSGALAERRVTTLLALSTNLRRQGRLAEALSGGREALRAAERVYGPEHHVTGDAMVHLGDHVYHIEQDTAAAEQLYRNGLQLLTQRFGENSIRLVHGLNSLAKLLSERGDASSEQLLRRALAIRQSATGPEHPGVADQNHRLASELARQGRTLEAEALAQLALDVSKRTLGETHPVIAQARLPLFAEVYDYGRRYQDADRVFNSALALSYPTGVVAGEMRRVYGRMLLRRGEYTRAEEQLLKSFELLKDAYRGTTHPNVQESSRALMELYAKWNRAELVEKYRVPAGRYIPY